MKILVVRSLGVIYIKDKKFYPNQKVRKVMGWDEEVSKEEMIQGFENIILYEGEDNRVLKFKKSLEKYGNDCFSIDGKKIKLLDGYNFPFEFEASLISAVLNNKNLCLSKFSKNKYVIRSRIRLTHLEPTISVSRNENLIIVRANEKNNNSYIEKYESINAFIEDFQRHARFLY